MSDWFYFEHESHRGIFSKGKSKDIFISIRIGLRNNTAGAKIGQVYSRTQTSYESREYETGGGTLVRKATEKEIREFKNHYVFAQLSDSLIEGQ